MKKGIGLNWLKVRSWVQLTQDYIKDGKEYFIK